MTFFLLIMKFFQLFNYFICKIFINFLVFLYSKIATKFFYYFLFYLLLYYIYQNIEYSDYADL